MPRDDDEDDWVGIPPEGRHSRDRARPDFWTQAWPAVRIVFALLFVALVVVLVLALT